jgi:hypothetical protein
MLPLNIEMSSVAGVSLGVKNMSDSFVLGVGFVIDREELDAALDYTSHDEHRWEAVSDDTGQWGDDLCLIIR